MSDILNDPGVQDAIRFQDIRLGLMASMVDKTFSPAVFAAMTRPAKKICVQYIVSQVDSEQELRDRLRKDLGIGDCLIAWSPPAEDRASREARALVKALGGLVAKNGALVMIMTRDAQF